MYVGIVQSTQRTIPTAKRVVTSATKTATKKLQQLSFDIKPNKLISEQKRNIYKAYGGGTGDLYSFNCNVDALDLYIC